MGSLRRQQELLSDRAPNEAYLAAKPGERYALYFANGGSVSLDLTGAPGPFAITWIRVAMDCVVESSQLGGYRLMDKRIEGGRVVTLSAPYKGGWVRLRMSNPADNSLGSYLDAGQSALNEERRISLPLMRTRANNVPGGR